MVKLVHFFPIFVFVHFIILCIFRQGSKGVVPFFCSGSRMSAIISGSAARWLKTMMTFGSNTITHPNILYAIFFNNTSTLWCC